MVELPHGEIFLKDICNGLHIIPACDGRTDGRTADACNKLRST